MRKASLTSQAILAPAASIERPLRLRMFETQLRHCARALKRSVLRIRRRRRSSTAELSAIVAGSLACQRAIGLSGQPRVERVSLGSVFGK